MKLIQPDMRERRVLVALFFITFVVAVLLTAFFHTQVVSGDEYAVRSERNRLRPITIPAPRGTIYDRYGEIVATSVPSFSMMLLPGSEETVRATLQDLAPFLGLAGEDVDELLERRKRRPNDLLTITQDATYPQVAAIEERRTSFPNLLVVDRPKRYYPAGEAVGHIMGYVAEISAEELERPQYVEAGYKQGRWIGKAGLERQYELLLSGQDGARFVEVDAMGRIVNPRSTVGVLPPTGGEDLHLTLDLGLQKYIAELFPDNVKGSIVLMAPSTGEILAMYSNPGFDPNDFVGGPSARLWRALSQDTLKPMLHRAVAALYPPASTFKLATAAMGLDAGVLEADTRMPIACAGGMSYAGRYARCWYAPGHGSLDLVSAIQHSCNVYFYQVGIRLGFNRFVEMGTRLGFSEAPGIDLPGDKAGEFPTGVDWWERKFGYAPQPSEIMSLAIGQGAISQSPLKMAQFYSAIAGNGRAPAPHLAKIETELAMDREGSLELDISEEALEALWAGAAQVVEQGTARLSDLARWQLYGKTGTAQNPHGPDHGWFAGFAGPQGQPPEVAVAIIVEHGLHGSDVAPLAAKAANYYLDRKYELPFDPTPTYLEQILGVDQTPDRNQPYRTAAPADTAQATN